MHHNIIISCTSLWHVSPSFPGCDYQREDRMGSGSPAHGMGDIIISRGYPTIHKLVGQRH